MALAEDVRDYDYKKDILDSEECSYIRLEKIMQSFVFRANCKLIDQIKEDEM